MGDDQKIDHELNVECLNLLKECPEDMPYSQRYKYLKDKFSSDTDKLELIEKANKNGFFIDLSKLDNPEKFVDNGLRDIQQRFDENSTLNDYIIKITNNYKDVPSGKYNINGTKHKKDGKLYDILSPENIKFIS